MPKPKEGELVVGVRLASSTVKRADKLIERLTRTELGELGRISRHAVLRLAITRGLEILEKEYK